MILAMIEDEIKVNAVRARIVLIVLVRRITLTGEERAEEVKQKCKDLEKLVVTVLSDATIRMMLLKVIDYIKIDEFTPTVDDNAARKNILEDSTDTIKEEIDEENEGTRMLSKT